MSSKKNTKTTWNVRQGIRFRLKPFQNVTFQLAESKATILVGNLSVTGVGLLQNSLKVWPEGDLLKGSLVIDGKKYPVTIKVIHENSGIVGCSFQNPESRLQKAIENYFRIELAALKLVHVETKSKTHGDETATFFSGQNNCDLFIREKNKKLVAFSLSYFGHYFEGTGKKLLMIGQKATDAQTTAKGYSLVKVAQKMDDGIVEGALRFIENIEQLSGPHKKVLKNIISQTT